MADARILVVDDDDFFRLIIAERLGGLGYDVGQAGSLAQARALVAEAPPDVALLDVRLPDGDGTELLAELVRDTDAACVMITAHGTVESAVAALKLGAADYLEKPFSLERLEATLASALERTALRREVRALRERFGRAGGMVGASAPMQEVFALIERVAPADSTTVLITGETGTGKGMIARLLHQLSPRAAGPFVNVTCSALSETLMESELFGHEKGAFTDAHTQKRGLVELADRGTLFLDEIGELTPRLQGKLLGFIEDKVFRRLGGTRDLRVDARVLAATNRELAVEVEAGRFRADLFYRLQVVPIRIPPLRERPADIPALTKTFIEEFNREFGKRIRGITPEALARLAQHRWPGNVRELRNVIERSVLLAEDHVLTLEMLPPELRDAGRRPTAVLDLGPEGVDLQALERSLLLEALRRTGGNRTAAGALLGLSRHQIRNRLRKFALES
ncbi:MAG: sigma-54-dependent Fis family transcriptional regulator [Gemmatimonadetes bacterium]|nr:sigma-54-dependent Fis family transcriptional regulator [Gemmatimonadota bacterium]